MCADVIKRRWTFSRRVTAFLPCFLLTTIYTYTHDDDSDAATEEEKSITTVPGFLDFFVFSFLMEEVEQLTL